jgi:hypothetical protein
VTVLGTRGDTIYSRVISQPAVRVPQQAIDNLLANQRDCGAFTADAIRDSIKRRVTPFNSFFTGIIPGNDRTVWLVQRPASDTSVERTAIGLDERGEIIGTITLPLNETPFAADRNYLWTVQTPRVRAPTVIARYRFEATPAQPPRSARAGTSPTPSRPPE